MYKTRTSVTWWKTGILKQFFYPLFPHLDIYKLKYMTDYLFVIYTKYHLSILF